MLNDVFGDGAIVQRVIDVFAGARLVCRVMDHDIHHDILAIRDLLLFDTNECA